MEVKMTREDIEKLNSLTTTIILLSTSPKEWRGEPNTTVTICIPESVKDTVTAIAASIGSKDTDVHIDVLIQDLVIKGISGLALTFASAKQSNAKIDKILSKYGLSIDMGAIH